MTNNKYSCLNLFILPSSPEGVSYGLITGLNGKKWCVYGLKPRMNNLAT
jgi:hypothetical protein